MTTVCCQSLHSVVGVVVLHYIQRAVALRSVWGRKFYCSNLVQKIIESTIAEPSTKATLTPSRCWALGNLKFRMRFSMFSICAE